MTDLSDNSVPLQQFMEQLLRDIVRADMQAQVLQHSGWLEMARSVGKRAGVDLAEGVRQANHLGVSEIKLSFYVEPVLPGMWQRIKTLTRRMLRKKRVPPARLLCRLSPDSADRRSAFQVTVTVARTAAGDLSLHCEPGADELGGVYVADIA